MECPNHNKKLEKIVTLEKQCCESCGRAATLFCKSCKYVQCAECRLCTARHQLVKIIELYKVKAEYGVSNSYSCNGCQKSKTVDDDGIWHCNECNYDICPDCAE